MNQGAETPLQSVSDRGLVTACLAGDERSWAEVWRRYGGVVKAVARRVGCTADESRDVLQQVALVALESLDRLRDPAKLPAWVAGVARYQALEVVRRRRPGEELTSDSLVTEASSEEELLRGQELALLRAGFHQLDQRCQRILRRLDLSEPADSYQQVAADEGLSPTSVGPIRRRCLNRLRKIFVRLSRSAPSNHNIGRGNGEDHG